ncbi:protein SAR DEFICIENT 1 [Cornus florida]|uniref:protein SAR DEFICIENT 1 n=1 Tax=Cornus florida TaxID=4283 RepID=UPI0028A23A04|nr:protein SAR DEFICIENT 1 [Cornus florida]
MAGKRFFDESGFDPDQPNDQRKKTKPSLASVIEEVVMVNYLQNFCSALEPMLRRVVSEEVEDRLRRHGAARSLTRSPSLRLIHELEPPSSLQLSFGERLGLPIFTGSKIVDIQNNPLQIRLVDTTSSTGGGGNDGGNYPIKVEIVVLDGDFPAGGDGDTSWSSEEFNKHVLRERMGKRPLLTGELHTTMRNNDRVAVIGDIEFTDNSSWIRSRKFRIGARVVQGCSRGVRIREAITESFVVKDHRGELYKKNHPPKLEDEVWRLEKIARDGAFHKKLASNSIHTVQDFLKLFTVDSHKLRNIVGVGMSEKMWEVTVKHARTCILGNKMYIYSGANHTIILNPICQVVRAVINGQTYHSGDLTSMNRAYIESLLKDAYIKWNSLQEIDGILNETPLLTQGGFVEQHPINQETVARSYQQHVLLTNGTSEMASTSSKIRTDQCNEWMINSTYLCSPVDSGLRYNISESSSEDEQLLTRPFMHP